VGDRIGHELKEGVTWCHQEGSLPQNPKTPMISSDLIG